MSELLNGILSYIFFGQDFCMKQFREWLSEGLLRRMSEWMNGHEPQPELYKYS
jgi:hypothetical protein